MINLQDKMDILNKIKGSLVAGAAGDALGYPVEFLSYGEIVSRYGKNGIIEYDCRHRWGKGAFSSAQITDDTQMTLYTIEGLLHSNLSDRQDILQRVTEEYITWMCLQKSRTSPYQSALACIEELNESRAPGYTCLSALEIIMDGTQVVNDSKGCGSIMRIAPVGLVGAIKEWSAEYTADVAADIALITHKHALSTLASAVCAVIIYLCVKNKEEITGEKFSEIVYKSIEIVRHRQTSDEQRVNELENICRRAIELSTKELPDYQIIEDDLGGGWVAEETLAIAIFSVMRHINDVKNCLVCAVNHSGDSDSTGAVAGNIIGSILGYTAIPSSLIDHLQLREFIELKAETLMDIYY